MEFLPWELLDFSDNGDAHDIENSNESLEKANNPLHSYNFTSQETMFISHIVVTSEEVSIAPGKRAEPVWIFSDNYCEELAFPCLVPTGKFGYKVKKELKPTPVKYFNQPLLNYSQNFAQIPIVYFLLGLFYNK